MKFRGSVEEDSSSRLLVVAGPTASGKSALSLDLALALNGEIVNLDSVQVYKGFDIGSAKLPITERRGVPHHLIDILEPSEQNDAQRFIDHAERAIADIRKRGKLPIITGGTTMYLTALLYGLAPLPPTDKELRKKLEEKDSQSLFNELVSLDPEAAAKLHINDRYRLIRAHESIALSGVAVSKLREEHGNRTLKHSALILVVLKPREELYRGIDLRSADMVKKGIIQETKEIIARFGKGISPLLALGYRQVVQHLEGELLSEKLAFEIAQETRRYAKRQLTYWRNEPERRGWPITPTSSDPKGSLEKLHPSEIKRKVKPFRLRPITKKELVEELPRALKDNLTGVDVWYIGEKTT